MKPLKRQPTASKIDASNISTELLLHPGSEEMHWLDSQLPVRLNCDANLGDKFFLMPTQAVTIEALKLLRKIERPFKKVHRPALIRKLKRINETSAQAITSEDGPIVTLTTFGGRIDVVYLAIESIARGRQLPSRISLWLEEELSAQALPQTLVRLQQRGLEINYTADLGPHKKYYPEVSGNRDLDKCFVTADDDTLYPVSWLENLITQYQQCPDTIHCYRAHRIQISPDGTLAPYSSWKHCYSTEPSHLHFSTGCFGVIFPPKMREELRDLGTAFIETCPRADDIWLNWVAARAGIPVKQILLVPKHFYEIPGTRATALFRYNTRERGNDTQLSATYTEDVINRLMAG